MVKKSQCRRQFGKLLRKMGSESIVLFFFYLEVINLQVISLF